MHFSLKVEIHSTFLFPLSLFFSINQRKASRLACIENEEDITSICSDLESVSCGNDVQSRDGCDLSDGEAEIVGLINKVEHMKKEQFILWLREFKEWMDIDPGKFVENSKGEGSRLHLRKKRHVKKGPNQGQTVEVSRYASDSVVASGDESSLNVEESDSSLVDTSASFISQRYSGNKGLLGNAGGAPLNDLGRVDQEHLKSPALKEISSAFSISRTSHYDTYTIQEAHRMAETGDLPSSTTINGISESHSSVRPSSPPQFQQDLLQRRQNLVEEILQVSADSFSVASSDSNTSCSEADYSGHEQSVPEIDNYCDKDYSNKGVNEHISLNLPKDLFNKGRRRENGIHLFDYSADHTSKQCSAGAEKDESACSINQHADLSGNRKNRKKAKKRFISILEESSDSKVCSYESDSKKVENKLTSHADAPEIVEKEQTSANLKRILDAGDTLGLSMTGCCTQVGNDSIVTYFNSHIVNSEAHENCSHCVCCNSVLYRDSTYEER